MALIHLIQFKCLVSSEFGVGVAAFHRLSRQGTANTQPSESRHKIHAQVEIKLFLSLTIYQKIRNVMLT
jgi:hypothetical protein